MEKTINQKQIWAQDEQAIEAQNAGEDSSAVKSQANPLPPAEFERIEGEEVARLRSEYTKHFDLGENRYQAVIYPEPVHYFSGNTRQWEEIDNNLDEVDAEDGRRVLTNRANPLRAELPVHPNEGPLMRLRHKGHVLEWTFEACLADRPAQVKDGPALYKEALEKAAGDAMPMHKGNDALIEKKEGRIETAEYRRLDRTEKCSEVTYAGLIDGVSVRYTLSGTRIKEDILIENREAFSRIAMKLPSTYRYMPLPSGGALVRDHETDQVYFEFEAPCAHDASGEAIECALRFEEMDGYVRLLHDVPEEYLDRAAYPLTIDPVVKMVGKASNVDAGYVNMLDDNALYTSYESFAERKDRMKMFVGKRGSALQYATLLRFKKLAQIKSSDTIISAKLKLARTSSSSKNRFLTAYAIEEDWDPSTATWGNLSVGSAPVEYASMKSSSVTLDLTSQCREWYRADEDGESKNYGILLRAYGSGGRFGLFSCDDSVKEKNRPTLTINYISHAGLLSRWTYESLSAGRAGTTHVDLFNGNVVHEHPDMAMSGGRMPVSVSHYYNSCLCTENKLRCGRGWRHSGLQYVYEKKVDSKWYYIWVDGTGCEHWFDKKKADEAVKDKETKQYTLTYKNAGKLAREKKKRPARIVIRDQSNVAMVFSYKPSVDYSAKWNSMWLLSIEDPTANRNKTTFTYHLPEPGEDQDEGDITSKQLRRLEGKLKKITDDAGRETRFEYDDVKNLLTAITFPNNLTPEGNSQSRRRLSFVYNSKNQLTDIRYSDLEQEYPEDTAHTHFIYYDNVDNRKSDLLKAAVNYDGLRVETVYENMAIGLSTYSVNDALDWLDDINTLQEAEDDDGAGTGGIGEPGEEVDMPREYLVDSATDQCVCRAESIGLSKGEPGTASVTYGTKEVFNYRMSQTDVTLIEAANNLATTGKTLSYRFDDKGNVTSIRDELGYTQFTQYKEKNFGDAATAVSKLQRAVVNRIRDIGLVSVAAVKTQWVSTSKRWSRVASSGNSAEVDTQAGSKCLGLSSMKLDRENGDGEVFFRQAIRIEAEKEHTFSAYVRAESVRADENKGFYIRAGTSTLDYTDWTESVKLTKTTNEDKNAGLATSGWDRITLELKVSGSGPRTVYVDFVHDGNEGTVWFAAPQMELGRLASSVSLLSNGDFYRYTTSEGIRSPRDWTPGDGIVKDDQHVVLRTSSFPEALSGNALQIKDKPRRRAANTIYRQSVNASGKKNDVFFVGGWANAKAMPNSVTDDRGFRLTVKFSVKKGGKYEWVYGNPSKSFYHFSGEWVGWQPTGGAVMAPEDYNQVQVNCVYKSNPNRALFTNIFLFREAFGQTYAYDKEKNVINATSLSGAKSKMEYDKFGNLTSYRKPGKDKDKSYEYVLGYGGTKLRSQKLLRKSTTPEQVQAQYEYDDYGNLISQLVLKKDKKDKGFIKTQTKYDDRSLYAVEKTDARGKKVKMEVDPNNGLLWSVTDPKNTKVSYSYDGRKRLESAQVEVGSGGNTRRYKNEYTYEDDRLKTVKHNTSLTASGDVKYTFNYDDLGAQTEVFVGDGTTQTLLSSNTYSADRSHRLERTEFANGGRVENVYDSFDRLVGVKYDNDAEPRYEYLYGANGGVGKVIDHHLERSHETEYDLAGRPKRSTTRDRHEKILYETSLKYDRYDRLEEFAESVRTSSGSNSWRSYKTEYEYDKDDRTTEVNFGSKGDGVEYTYDGLGRIAKKVITNASGSEPSTREVSYDYLSGGHGKSSTTPLVSKINQGAYSREYEYDDTGNIITEKRSTGSNRRVVNYKYDQLGQLTRVDDPDDDTASADGTTWVYEYDMGGNIRYRYRYPYTTASSLGDAPYATRYDYDASWRDQLEEYVSGAPGERNPTTGERAIGGTPEDIEYDEIGNPTSYNGWGFTWEKGRQLKAMERNAGKVKAEFKYNASGLRVQKIVTEKTNLIDAETGQIMINVGTTDYTLHGKLITHIRKHTKLGRQTAVVKQLHVYYDAQSRPIMLEDRGAKKRYTLVHNLQGDVISILDDSGVEVVRYRYDAWGQPVSSGFYNAEYAWLKELNPFRYRGYVYDQETGLYYLRSRYYEPALGRFLNADGLAGTNGKLLSHNPFMYCRNNPIQFVDPNGTDFYLPENFWQTYREGGALVLDELVIIKDCLEIDAGIGAGIGYEDKLEGTIEYGFYAGIDIINFEMENGECKLSRALILDGSLALPGNLGGSASYKDTIDYANPNVDNPGEFSYEFLMPYVKAASINSDNDIKVGFSKARGVGLGAHVSIAFNLSKYDREGNPHAKQAHLRNTLFDALIKNTGFYQNRNYFFREILGLKY